MKIDDSCIRCRQCIPYCPVAAIVYDGKKDLVYVDQDECVECGVCMKSEICPVKAFIQPELKWPRTMKAKWSSVVYVHPETNIQGRGTDEMKTNDVTGRFRPGEVGFALELGRPSTGARFGEAEKLTTVLARLGVQFEPMNPLTGFIDTETGRFLESWFGHALDDEFRNTKVMTFIIEFKVAEERMLQVIEAIRRVSREIDTVMSVGLIVKCDGSGGIPIKPKLDKEGIRYYINGKTNVGLGRPSYDFDLC
jgi:NAD-dependent dihydropyrimidine dehydrogenase PreA subunit